MAIGLRGSWKETRGCGLRFRLSRLKLNLKCAWQRAWRGWDDVDMFNMYDNFIDREKEILKDYRNNHCGLFNVPAEYRDIFNKWNFDEEETNIIIETMIFHLEMMDEDYVEKLLYGKNVYDDDYIPTCRSFDEYKRISSIMNQNKNAFMKLFNIFFWELYD